MYRYLYQVHGGEQRPVFLTIYSMEAQPSNRTPFLDLPEGTVTFLFSDIQGSTNLLYVLGDQFTAVLSEHHRILREAVAQYGGQVVRTEGDAFFVAFQRAQNAVSAAVEVQRCLAEYKWPEGASIQVRMGLHTGEPEVALDDYVGLDVHRAARIAHVGHGSQVLLSETTTALVQDTIPAGVSLSDLGRHLLKDIRRPERICQLIIEGLPSEFPPLNTLGILPPDGARLPRQVGECPYRGLSTFQEVDTQFYFGREGFVDTLEEAIHARKLVTVILGPSGSGKSSALLAGLLPRLRKAGGFQFIVFRPGNQPFYALAGALLQLLEPNLSEANYLSETSKLAESLMKGEVRLEQVVKRVLAKFPEIKQVLLAIDQFEELYTQCPISGIREAFIDELLAGVGSAKARRDPSAFILMTMRADFLGQALAHRPLAEVLQEGSLMMGPMKRQELHQAIEKPAELQGAAFEVGLVKRILDDVGEKSGNLPLLEFTLTQLWNRQSDGWLTHADYEALGCVDGALASYADRVYSSLGQIQQEQARHIFTQMVRPGEGTVDTRRLALREELGEEHWTLVQELADARLLVTGRDAASGRETVEVVHEALIQSWGQLREWMAEDRIFRSWQERLRAALRQWEMSDRDEGVLLRGAPLIEAQRWLTERESALSSFEKELILQSIALRKREQVEIDRRRHVTFIALTAGVIIALILALIAFQERQSALTQARIASARELTLASQTNLKIDPELSILLGLQSASIWKDLNQSLPSDLQYVLHQAIQSSRARTTWPTGEEEILAVGFIQPGDIPRVITADPQSKTVSIWNPETNQKLMTIPDSARASSLSSDGSMLAVAGKDNSVSLLDIPTNETLRDFKGHTSEIRDGEFSLDGDHLLTRSQSEYIVWEVGSGKLLLEIPAPSGDHLAAVFSNDGKYLAALDQDRSIKIFEITSGQQTSAIQPGFDVITIAYSPDGTQIAGAGRENYGKVWDITTGDTVLTLDFLEATSKTPGGQYETITYSPDGIRLVVGGVIWDASSGEVLFPIRGHTEGISSQSFNSDGNQLITASYDKTVKIWDLTYENEVLTRSQPPGGFYYCVAFSPDGKWMVTTAMDKSPTVSDVATGKEIATLIGHTDAVNAADFNVDGTLLATGSADRTVIVWDTQSWQSQRTLTGHLEDKPGMVPVIRGVVDIDFSPKCASLSEPSTCPLAGVGMDGQLVVWDAFTAQVLYTYQDQQGGLKSVAFSPDGKLLAIGSTGDFTNFMGSIIIFDANTGQMLSRLPGEANSGWVWDLAFNPDGNQLAALSFRGDGKIWDVATGEVQHTLKGLGSGLSVAYNPDGTLLATGGSIGNINLWEADSGVSLFSLPGHAPSPIYSLTFSSDGKYLASAGFDGTARVFVIPSEELLALARSRLTREFTTEECQKFLHIETCPAPMK